MSADMMVICKEDKSSFDGGNTEAARFIDETSVGDPHTEFGVWFQTRFCGAPRIFEQLNGIREHNYTEIKQTDVVAVKDAIVKMECHTEMDAQAVIRFMESHVGKHISTENW
jgi:hypothetical protein